MKILVLNPPFVDDFCRSARWAAKSRGRVQRHPDWLLIATAVLEKSGHQIKFVDGAAQNLKKETVLEIGKRFVPELAVLHTTTPSIYNDMEYAGALKEKTGCKIVLVGPHVSAVPDNTLEIAQGRIDCLARGEYDYILRDLADGINWREIDGLSFSEGSEVIHNKARKPLDVNELPFPAWRHIDPNWYHDGGKKFPFLTLLSGRGCFGQCTFCRDTPIMYGQKLRFRNPALVVDEIEYDLKLFPSLQEIMFETDTFVASPSHVRGVCEELLKRNIRISWSCNTRVDMDLSLLPLMKKAGCRMLMTGFEFGSQQALDAVKKGITLEQSRKFAEEAHRLGFTIHGCFMIGAPGETRQTARQTIDFAKSLPLDTIQISGICAYPGTEIYEWGRKNGYLIPHDWRDWVSEDYEQATLMNYPQLSKEEIDELIDQGLKEFYLRPKQIVDMLLAIRSWGDLKRKAFGFKSFINYFSK